MTAPAVMRQKRVRYRSRSWEIRIAVPSLSVLVWGLGIPFIVSGIAAGSSQGFEGSYAIGAGAFLALFGLSCIASPFWPLLVLTTHTLRRPRALRRAQIIPLDQVTGVGLVYKRHRGAPTPDGWFLYLWTTGDRPLDTGIAYQPASWLLPVGKVRQKFLAVEPSAAELRRPFNSYRFSFNFNPVTQTDPDKIAVTYAGRVAREVYDRVLAYQGPSGLLAARQDQKYVPATGAYDEQSVYWSPDGEFGYAATKPPPHGPARPANLAPRPERPGPMLRLQYRLRLVGRKFQRRGHARGMF